MLTHREKSVLELIRRDPMMSQQEIAARLGISRSAVAGHVMRLTDKGVIMGRGYVFGDSTYTVVVGGANLDIHGKARRALRKRDSNPGDVNMSPGGVARNIAENLARLGVAARLITAIGDDPHGELILQAGKDAGIDMRFVHVSTSAPTSTYLSIVDDHGEMRLAVSDMTIADELTPQRLQQHHSMLRRAALLFIDANLSGNTLEWLCSEFHNAPVFADTVSTRKADRLRPVLGSIHTLKTGTAEIEALTGMESRTEAQLKKTANDLHARGVRRVFVTRGKDGVFHSSEEGQGIYKLRGAPADVHNVGGAGDAFLAGMGYAWLEKWPLEESIQVALAAAQVTVADAATSSPALSVDAVNRLLEAHRAA